VRYNYEVLPRDTDWQKNSTDVFRITTANVTGVGTMWGMTELGTMEQMNNPINYQRLEPYRLGISP